MVPGSMVSLRHPFYIYWGVGGPSDTVSRKIPCMYIRDDHKRDLASRLKDDRKVAQTTGQSTGMEGIYVGCHELKLNEIDNT